MSAMQVQFSPTPDDDTAAAILAAIMCYLEPNALADSMAASPDSAWRAAGMLAAQGLPPSRGATPPTWSTAERTERAAHWSTGIVGM
jgi:hypothetical protein